MDLKALPERSLVGTAPATHGGVAGAGRHTLGCDPDAAGQPIPAPRRASAKASEPEPERLSRPVWWLAAQQRASRLEADEEGRRLVALLIAHVEAAWAWIAELEALCRNERGRMDCDDPQSHFLQFAESDVVDLFRSLAQDAANMVPGPAGWQEEPDPDGMQGEAERFNRYLAMLVLAATDPKIPEDVRMVVQRVGRDLGDWYPDFVVLAGAAARSTLFRRVGGAEQ